MEKTSFWCLFHSARLFDWWLCLAILMACISYTAFRLCFSSSEATVSHIFTVFLITKYDLDFNYSLCICIFSLSHIKLLGGLPLLLLHQAFSTIIDQRSVGFETTWNACFCIWVDLGEINEPFLSSTCLSSCQCHTVLVTVAFSVSPPSLFFSQLFWLFVTSCNSIWIWGLDFSLLQKCLLNFW